MLEPLSVQAPQPVDGQIPLVSVIIPCLNGAPYIQDTLWSLLRQTIDSFEIVVVDGGSIDGSIELISEFPQVTLIERPGETYSEAFWTGLASSRGHLIMQHCMSDMLLDEGWLATASQLLDDRPDLGLVWGLNRTCDEHGQLMDVSLPESFLHGLPDSLGLFRFWLLTAYALPETNFVARRLVLEKCLPRPEEELREDMDPWLEFNFRFHTAGYRAAAIPRVASALRLHPDSNLAREKADGRFERRLTGYLSKVQHFRWAVLTGRCRHAFVDGQGQVLAEVRLARGKLASELLLWLLQAKVSTGMSWCLKRMPEAIEVHVRQALRTVRLRLNG